MPVREQREPKTVSRTQQQTIIANRGEGWDFTEWAGETTLEVGEIFSAVQGGIAGEWNKGRFFVSISGPLRFEFNPPHRRTVFHLTDLSVSLPTTFLSMRTLTPATFKAAFETGWVVQVIIGGAVVLSEVILIGNSSFTTTAGAITIDYVEMQPVSRQVQLTQEVTVSPGTSFEVVCYPFMRVTEAVSAEVENIAFSITSPNATSTSKRVKGTAAKQSSAIVVYQQEF